MSSTKILAVGFAKAIKVASRLLGPRRRKKFRGHLHQLLMPVADVRVSGQRLHLVVPDRGSAYWPLSGIDREPETLRWIDSFMGGDTFFDVGANVGLFSLYAAAARHCVCVAFEPNPFSFDALVRNVMINGQEKAILPFCLAVGNGSEIAQLGITSGDAGSVGCTLAGRDDARLLLTTQVVPLDQMVKVGGMPFPNHLKVDVDGREDEVLAGSQAVLRDRRLRSLLVEVVALNDDSRRAVRSGIEGVGLALVLSESSSENWLFRRRP